MDCIFCKIANGEIKTNFLYEDDSVVAFNDLDPQAPVHVLIIPKKHYSSIMDLNEEDEKLIGHIFTVAKKIAKDLEIADSGFRVVTNVGKDGGQSVNHIHFHLLGKRKMSWPPG